MPAAVPSLDEKSIRAGCRHLKKADPVLAAVMKQVGPFLMNFEPDPLIMLSRSIVGQQISMIAARAIWTRLNQALSPDSLTALSLARLSERELREAGLSRRKADYVHSLAESVVSGELDLDALAFLPDEEVVARLVQLRGVGIWTAQMFLIFCLGRRDVFPHDDFGVRAALKNLYELDDYPARNEAHAIAACWRPHATIASWYLWRSLELKPAP